MENLPLAQEEIPELQTPENIDGKVVDVMAKLADLKKKAEEDLVKAGIKPVENKTAEYQSEIESLQTTIVDLEMHGYSAKAERERLNFLEEKIKEEGLVKI